MDAQRALFGGLMAAALAAAGCGSKPPKAACGGSAPARTPTHYAVLVNGDTERRHKDNVAEAYRTLRTLGFPPERIFVLSPRDRRAGLPRTTLRLAPVPDSFDRVMDELGAQVERGDLLLVYGTGHGDVTDDGQGFLALGRGELWPDELREEIERLPADAVIVMDQCFSGAFAEGFRGTRHRAIVVSTVDAKHETDCEYFTRAFWQAFLHPETADRNGDGKTSVHEAFGVAMEAHRKGLEGDPDLSSNGAYDAFNGFADALLN